MKKPTKPKRQITWAVVDTHGDYWTVPTRQIARHLLNVCDRVCRVEIREIGPKKKSAKRRAA
jgi:hypothetical protein